MPHKPPIDPVRWTPPPVDPLPEFGPAELTVVPMPGEGPEDVVADESGRLWTGLVDGRIVRVSPDGAAAVIADTGGRPLGLHVARDGRVLICDSHRGLLALDPNTGALSTLVESVNGRPLTFCSNVTEIPDGTIYFTESTSRFHFEHFDGASQRAAPAASTACPPTAPSPRSSKTCTSPTESLSPPTDRRWCSPKPRRAGCPSTG